MKCFGEWGGAHCFDSTRSKCEYHGLCFGITAVRELPSTAQLKHTVVITEENYPSCYGGWRGVSCWKELRERGRCYDEPECSVISMKARGAVAITEETG